jgi:hypothetical protein
MAETCFFSSESQPSSSGGGDPGSTYDEKFDFDREYRYQDELIDEEASTSTSGEESR